MAISPLDKFNAVVGVTSLVLGVVGLAKPDETQEKLDDLARDVDEIKRSLDVLADTVDGIVNRLDGLTELKLAEAVDYVNLARDGLAEYDSEEFPSDDLVAQIKRDSAFGLERVLSQFGGLDTRDPIEPDAAAAMAEAITLALATRFDVINRFDDRAVGRDAFRESVQEAATALRQIADLTEDWIETRPIFGNTSIAANEGIRLWPATQIANTEAAQQVPGLSDRFAAFGSSTMSETSVRSIVEDHYGAPGFIDFVIFPVGAAKLAQQAAAVNAILGDLPYNRLTMFTALTDEAGDLIYLSDTFVREVPSEDYQDTILNVVPFWGVTNAIATFRAEQMREVNPSRLDKAAQSWSKLADGVERTDPGSGRGDADGTVMGSAGNDFLNGLAGNDLLQGMGDADVLRGGTGRDTLDGGGGADNLLGGAGRDILRGQSGADRLDGGDGRDKLFGGKNDDLLTGGAGRDRLKGGAGDDELDGGAGRDRMTGGAGADVFVLTRTSGDDTITDFDPSEDALLLLGLRENALTYVSRDTGTEIQWDTGSVLLRGLETDGTDITFI